MLEFCKYKLIRTTSIIDGLTGLRRLVDVKNNHRLAIIALALAACLFSSFTHANAIKFSPVEISYQVNLQSSRLGNATLGQLQTQLTPTQKGYQVVSETKVEGMAAVLMGSNLKETCDFEVISNEVVSRAYQGGRGSKIDYQVGFDWVKRKIEFSHDEVLDMPRGYVIDNCNLPFAFAVTQGQGLDQPMYIIDGKKQRVRGYTLQSSSVEMLETSIGKLETTKIVMQRELKPEKTLTLWLAHAHQYLPVKMEEKRSSRTTTMLLNSLEQLDL
jgi:hypothetical protein